MFATFINALPTRITGWTKVIAWATLISNTLIILTGGAVRLTASGLGCPTWPRCTDETWVATPEMGLHGAIEFGNRTLTFLLVVVATLMFLSVARLWHSHRPLVVLSLLVLAGIPAQAAIGGITVLTNLNPWVVAFHFLVSSGLVMVSTMLLRRIYHELKPQQVPGTPLISGARDYVTTFLAAVVLAASWAAVVLGTVVTGTGPHAGDPGSPRHEFDPEFVTRLHTAPVYLLVLATLVLIIRQFQLATSGAQRRAAILLVVSILIQGGIGYWQHFTGLPILLVAMHMVGSAILMAAATLVFDEYRSKYKARGLSREELSHSAG